MTENLITMEDDSGSDEEEELLVYCDFESLVSTEDLNSGVLKIIGIDDEHPVVQVNDKFFKGTYNFSMGTNIFFERDDEAVDDTDPLYGPYTPLLYSYYGKSIKTVKMERIFVQPVDTTETTCNAANSKSDSNIQPTVKPTDESSKYVITKTYGEALNQLLGPGESPPRNLADDENSKMEIDLKLSAASKKAQKKTGDGGDDDDDEDDGPAEDDPKDEDYIPYEMDVG